MKENKKERQRSARLMSLLCLVSAFFLLSAFSCRNKTEMPLLTSAYWTAPIMTANQAAALAQHDIVVVDIENVINNRQSLVIMKKLNSDIKLLCYSNPMEIFDPVPANRPLQNAWANEIKAKYPQWLLKTGSGANSVFWPGMIMINMSSSCPLANTEYGPLRYNQWIARKLVTQALSDSIWDGHFTDNCTQDVSWIQNGGSQIDIDGDGISDNPVVIDQNWENGMRNFLYNLRSNTRPGFLLFGNKGVLNYADILDGLMFENFPNDYLGSKTNSGWDQSILNTEMATMFGTVRFVIYQVKEADLEFGLASALLFDNVYIALGQDNDSFPEILKIDPGKPTGDRTKIASSFWFRDYENASVEVYPPLRKGLVVPSSQGGMGQTALKMGAQ